MIWSSIILRRHTMVYVTKRRMKRSSTSWLFQSSSLSNQLLEIDSLCLKIDGTEEWYKKEDIHDWIKEGNVAKVNVNPYPELQAMVSSSGEKYVRSSPNGSTSDNLLNLPLG